MIDIVMTAPNYYYIVIHFFYNLNEVTIVPFDMLFGLEIYVYLCIVFV